LKVIGAINGARHHLPLVYCPDYEKAFLNIGLCRYMQGDQEGALANFTKSIEINPRYSNPYISRGALLIELGDYFSGCKDLRIAVKLGDRDATEILHDIENEEY
jgi:Tfp pilus assembly protein PilF